MNNRVVDNKQYLIECGRAILGSIPNCDYYERVQLVTLVLSGVPASTIADATGKSRSSISGWVKKVVEEDGYEGLISKPIPGKPPRLTKEQLELLEDVLQKDASEYGYNLWEGKSISDYIKKTFDVDLGVRQCQRLMHTLGFSLQRPQTIPGGKVDEEAREEFKKNSK